ncbi:hypothetical protein GCM10028827_03320 [Mucilaginibacter myungsuensis]
MNIVPFTSVGNLYFTDTREGLREKIGEEYQSGIDDLGGYKSYYDFYQGRDLLIYFDEQDVVTAFEFFSPEAEYRDIDILSESYDKLIGLFKVFDPGITIDEGGFDAPELGLRVHTPDSEQGGDVPESVLIYRRDYYED